MAKKKAFNIAVCRWCRNIDDVAIALEILSNGTKKEREHFIRRVFYFNAAVESLGETTAENLHLAHAKLAAFDKHNQAERGIVFNPQTGKLDKQRFPISQMHSLASEKLPIPFGALGGYKYSNGIALSTTNSADKKLLKQISLDSQADSLLASSPEETRLFTALTLQQNSIPSENDIQNQTTQMPIFDFPVCESLWWRRGKLASDEGLVLRSNLDDLSNINTAVEKIQNTERGILAAKTEGSKKICAREIITEQEVTNSTTINGYTLNPESTGSNRFVLLSNGIDTGIRLVSLKVTTSEVNQN